MTILITNFITLLIGALLAVVFIRPILDFLGETKRRITNVIKSIKGE